MFCVLAATVLSGRTDCTEYSAARDGSSYNISASLRKIDMLFSGKEENREEN